MALTCSRIVGFERNEGEAYEEHERAARGHDPKVELDQPWDVERAQDVSCGSS